MKTEHNFKHHPLGNLFMKKIIALYIFIQTFHGILCANNFQNIPLENIISLKKQKETGVDQLNSKQKEALRLYMINLYLDGYNKGQKDYIAKLKKNVTTQKPKPSKPTSKKSTTGKTDLVSLLNGAKIYAQDSKKTYLGKISSSTDTESIFNEYGTYGNDFSTKSIWNEFSTFGNEFNAKSPFNEFSSNPPMIIKNGKVIGYLTTNEFMSGAVSPAILKSMKDKF